ncbi:dehydratase [Streptomyces alboflavus]|uniref:Dehydratase n=1 Tax=Streptomyces alboflavus TaxID=67267 RepID=A0A1Z1WS70_9ACTN|nr:dehydratase [Streptomyces alboflavus]
MPVLLERGDFSRETAIFDHSVRRGLIGDCSVAWKTGIARTLAELFEEYQERIGEYFDTRLDSGRS